MSTCLNLNQQTLILVLMFKNMINVDIHIKEQLFIEMHEYE